MTTAQFTLDDLKSILVNRVGYPANDIPEDPSATFEDMGLDSLAFVEIQLELEQRYGFKVSDEDAQSITTLGDAVDYTNRRLQESAA